MDDCVDQVGSANFVSKFDLLKGYWQVLLSKQVQEIAAFVTPSGLFKHKDALWIKERSSHFPAAYEQGC